MLIFIVLLTFLNLSSETTSSSLRGDRRVQRDNRQLNPQQTCQARFEQHNCQQLIDQDLAHRDHYLNCHQNPSLRDQAISCAWGGVQGFVDIGLGLTMIPALPFTSLVQDQNCSESENNQNRKDIIDIVRPLISEEIYQNRIRVMGCAQLAQWVEQQVERYVSEIDAKQRNQASYEAYINRDLTRQDIVANANRRFPASERNLTEAEQEFYRRYQVRQNAQNEFPNIFEKFRRTNLCASPQYLAELACRGVARLGLTGAAARVATGSLARRSATDLEDLRRINQRGNPPSQTLRSTDEREALDDERTVLPAPRSMADERTVLPGAHFTETGLGPSIPSPPLVPTTPLTRLSGRRVSPIEDQLRSGQIVSRRPAQERGTLQRSRTEGENLESQTGAEIVRLDNGLFGVWKPQREGSFASYRAEIFAYELDQKLGFNAVPPTVEYRVGDQVGSLQLFRRGTPTRRTREQRLGLEDVTPTTVQRHQLNRESLFDYLLDNRDRHSRNHRITADGQVVSIDHGLSYSGAGRVIRSFNERRPAIRAFLNTNEGRLAIQRIRREHASPNFRREAVDYIGAENTETLLSRMQQVLDFYDSGMH
jgi:hypothetical protein